MATLNDLCEEYKLKEDDVELERTKARISELEKAWEEDEEEESQAVTEGEDSSDGDISINEISDTGAVYWVSVFFRDW